MNIKKIITAILLVSDGPMHHSYFQETFDIGHDELLNVYSEINNDLEKLNFGFEIVVNKSSVDFVTVESLKNELTKFKPPSVLRGLSTPSLETLSIVAYEQPVTKLKINEIRGVESESSIKTLESRGLIEKSGIMDIPGSPHLYVTTNMFLNKLGIGSLSDLPLIGDYFSSTEEE
jgi:segregation and condensation protein B